MKKSDTIATRLAVKSVQRAVRNCRLQLLQQAIDMRMDLQRMGRILLSRVEVTCKKKTDDKDAKKGGSKPRWTAKLRKR